LGYDYLKKSILFTGSNGYLGRNFLKTNSSKNIIKISSSLANNNYIKCDLTNLSDVKNLFNSYNFSKIINLAGYVPKNKEDYSSDQALINELIINNIISYFKCDLFHFSTQAVYENNSSLVILEKNKINMPSNKYAIYKLNAEQQIKKRYKGKYYIIRIPGIFGADRKNGIIYNFIKFIKNEQNNKFKVNTPKIWSTMYYKDVNLLLAKLLKIKINNNLEINYNYYNQPNLTGVINFIYNYYYNKNYIENTNNENYYFNQSNRLKNLGKIRFTLYQRLEEYIRVFND
tara:strand:+ start:193 stop:1053 length:861 start_codon:yes stop_codon:yes gene_type:complete